MVMGNAIGRKMGKFKLARESDIGGGGIYQDDVSGKFLCD